jgi:DNA-directed RNA polymerase subunit RPC12/RpoP
MKLKDLPDCFRKVVFLPRDDCPYCGEYIFLKNSRLVILHTGVLEKNRWTVYYCHRCGAEFRMFFPKLGKLTYLAKVRLHIATPET